MYSNYKQHVVVQTYCCLFYVQYYTFLKVLDIVYHFNTLNKINFNWALFYDA